VGIWKPLVFALLVSLVTLAILGLLLARRLDMDARQLLLKLRAPFVTALRSGSLGESFAEAQHSCTHLLGIDMSFVRVGLPQGLVLYMPVSAIGPIIFTLFAARTLGVEADPTWYASAIIMAVVVFVATPPVPGANLLAYVALFSALGIPGSVLPDAMIFDIVFGIFAGAANQAMLQMEMVLQTSRLGLLDKQVLRRSA
jgi:Na+/H+-dicarboxylate symporter